MNDPRELDRAFMKSAFTDPYLQFKANRLANQLKRDGSILGGNIILEVIHRWREDAPHTAPEDLGQVVGFKSDGDMRNCIEKEMDSHTTPSEGGGE